MLNDILKQIVVEKQKVGYSKFLTMNFLKEYLQYMVLSLLYNHPEYKNLVFKGGTCLRICYDLPRLSEDIDFDYEGKSFGSSFLLDLEKFLNNEIQTRYFSKIETKIQGDGRIYLKFPILKELNLAGESDSDLLFVKVETEKANLIDNSTTVTPISKFGYNFLAKNYRLPFLMSGKINAVLNRMWFKGDRNQVDIKGRDFYDLYWFLQQGVVPNLEAIETTPRIETMDELKIVLKKRIRAVVTPQKLSYDLVNFVPEGAFVEDFSKNYLSLTDELLEKVLG